MIGAEEKVGPGGSASSLPPTPPAHHNLLSAEFETDEGGTPPNPGEPGGRVTGLGQGCKDEVWPMGGVCESLPRRAQGTPDRLVLE